MLYEIQKMRGFRLKDINKLKQQEAFLKELTPDDDISNALIYIREYKDARRPAMILTAPPSIRHIFDRIAEIILCEREEIAHHRYMVRENEYHFNSVKDPGGELTDEQLKEVYEFWKPYEFCYKCKPDIQRHFSVASGRFDPSYVPWAVYKFTRRYWAHAIENFMVNKNYLSLVYPNVKKAKTVVRNYGGCYHNAERDIITIEEACEICYEYLKHPQHNEIIVKQCVGGCGDGVSFLRKGNTREEIMSLFKSYVYPFICEEVIIQHDKYAEPHPESLNTLRILTVSYESEIFVTGVLFRMGIGSNRVDNTDKGGLVALVDDDGSLSSYALDGPGNKFYQHPSGYVFEGKKLPYVDRAVETAKKLHATTLQHRCIAWDIAIDRDGDPVLIELNGIGGQFSLQLFGKHTFVNAEITKKLLDDWILKQFSYRRASWNWNFREYSDHIEITKYDGLYTSVTVPDKMNGKPVTVIKNGAFSNGKMIRISLPSSIVKIEENAFTNAGKSCSIIKR